MKDQINIIWNYLNLLQIMVRQVDIRWNYFICSLMTMYKKLERLFEEDGGPS